MHSWWSSLLIDAFEDLSFQDIAGKCGINSRVATRVAHSGTHFPFSPDSCFSLFSFVFFMTHFVKFNVLLFWNFTLLYSCSICFSNFSSNFSMWKVLIFRKIFSALANLVSATVGVGQSWSPSHDEDPRWQN